MAAKIRKGDKVVVTTGRDKGRTGEVIEIRSEQGRAVVTLPHDHSKGSKARDAIRLEDSQTRLDDREAVLHAAPL